MMLKCEICGGKEGTVQFMAGQAVHPGCKGRQEAVERVHKELEASSNSTQGFMLLDQVMAVFRDNSHLALSTDAGRLTMAMEIVKAIQDGRLSIR